MNALRVEDDTKDLINFNNGTFNTEFIKYTGTDRDVRSVFSMKHIFSPIFEKVFDGSDSSIVSIIGNSITIPDHFFVTGEKLDTTQQVYQHQIKLVLLRQLSQKLELQCSLSQMKDYL